MRIETVRSYVVENPWNPWFFVEVVTDTGLCGIGEGAGYHWARANVAYLEQNKDVLFIGRDPHDIEALVVSSRRMLGIDRGLGMVERSVLSAVEIACWDILGQHFQTPVYKLLGGKCREAVRVYANGWYSGLDARDPEQWADKARRVIEAGYTAIKFDPFGKSYRDIEPGLFRHAVNVVRRVRDAVGPDVGMIVELHARFHVETAIRIAQAIEQYDIMWLEAPVLGYLSAEAHKEVARRVNIPVGTDVAGIADLVSALPFLTNRAVAVIQPDVGYSGGLLEVKKIGALAEAVGVFVAPHQSLGPVVSAASVHVSLALPAFLILERFEDFAYPDWSRELVGGQPVVKNGTIQPPTSPGLGISFSAETAAKHPLKGDRIINLLADNWEKRR